MLRRPSMLVLVCSPVLLFGVAAEPPVEEEPFVLESGPAPEENRGQSGWWRQLRVGLEKNLLLNLDLITRAQWMYSGKDYPSTFFALGLDMNKVVSSRKGDVGRLILQPYLLRRSSTFPIPAHVEDEEDWELEFHDFYFNLTKWGRGRRNIKIGHFDVPFGLEPFTDSHFKLHQLIPVQNLGMKKDWGISLNGAWPMLDYEISLSRGSGFEYNDKGDNFVVAARVATPNERNVSVGLSALFGRLIDPMRIKRWRARAAKPPSSHEAKLLRNGLIERYRFGLDTTWAVSAFTVKAEMSYGKDFDQRVVNGLAEINWAAKDDDPTAYIQGVWLGQRGEKGWDEDVRLHIGFEKRLASRWYLEARLSQELASFGGRPRRTALALQLKYSLPYVAK